MLNIINMIKKNNKFPKKIIMVISLQKCGTHLIERVMNDLGYLKAPHPKGILSIDAFKGLNNSQYIRSHFCPNDEVQMALEKNSDIKIIFNYRDPRDVFVSWFHWIHPNNPKPMHVHMEYMQKVYKNLTDLEIVNHLMDIDKFRAEEYNILEHFKLSRVLLFHPSVLNVKFEDLIGPKGGGSRNIQIQTIRKICDYLDKTEVDYVKLADSAFSIESPTFRKGQIGSYKLFLSDEQIKKFNKLYKNIIIQYGYTL